MSKQDSRQRFWDLFEGLNGAGPALKMANRKQYNVVSEMMGHDQLSHLSMVWYETDGQKAVAYNAANARPAIVGKVARELNEWPVSVYSEGVTSWRNSLKNGAQPKPLLAYGLSESKGLLLLDGNHRAVAIVAERCPRKVEVLILLGPMDEAVLPDLKHYKP